MWRGAGGSFKQCGKFVCRFTNGVTLSTRGLQSSSVDGRLPHQVGSSFCIVRAFEKCFGGLTILTLAQVFGQMAHEELAVLERADGIPECVVHLFRDVCEQALD